MTRSELISRVRTHFPDLTDQDVEAAVSAILSAIAQTLAQGARVELRGFGAFTVNYHPPRSGRNPTTRVKVSVPAKYAPNFKPARELRERVNSAVSGAKPGVGQESRKPKRLKTVAYVSQK